MGTSYVVMLCAFTVLVERWSSNNKCADLWHNRVCTTNMIYVYGVPGNLDSLICSSPLRIFFPSMEDKEHLTLYYVPWMEVWAVSTN